MVFLLTGLVAAMLFGVFFGSEGDLPPEVQDAVFMGLILLGVILFALQILFETLCRRCHCRICPNS